MTVFDNDYYDNYETYEEPDPPEKQLCNYCCEYVEPYFVDEGIGDYEYWGYKGRDVQLIACCPRCDSYLED